MRLAYRRFFWGRKCSGATTGFLSSGIRSGRGVRCSARIVEERS
jgi:hypothetical protein